MEEQYDNVHIFIQTRGRYNRAQRRTIKNFHLEELCKNKNFNVKLIIPQIEKQFWVNTTPIQIEAVPNDWRIEDVRQYILDKYQRYKYHVVIDDGLKLRKRNKYNGYWC